LLDVNQKEDLGFRVDDNRKEGAAGDVVASRVGVGADVAEIEGRARRLGRHVDVEALHVVGEDLKSIGVGVFCLWFGVGLHVDVEALSGFGVQGSGLDLEVHRDVEDSTHSSDDVSEGRDARHFVKGWPFLLQDLNLLGVGEDDSFVRVGTGGVPQVLAALVESLRPPKQLASRPFVWCSSVCPPAVHAWVACVVRLR
jgi:hypothetical protein